MPVKNIINLMTVEKGFDFKAILSNFLNSKKVITHVHVASITIVAEGYPMSGHPKEIEKFVDKNIDLAIKTLEKKLRKDSDDASTGYTFNTSIAHHVDPANNLVVTATININKLEFIK